MKVAENTASFDKPQISSPQGQELCVLSCFCDFLVNVIIITKTMAAVLTRFTLKKDTSLCLS